MYKNSDQRTQDYLTNFNEHDVIKQVVKKTAPIIVDIGANIGQTVDKVKKVWPLATVHSIEPLVKQYTELKTNVQYYDNVYTYNYALSSYNGPREFHINKHQVMLSSFYELNENSNDSIALNNPEPAHKNFLDSETVIVDCKTLDSWAVENNVTYIDLLKLDTQGSEPEILQGGIGILNNTRVIITELMFYDLYKKQNSFYDIESILLPLGFKLFDIGHISKNPLTGRTDWADVIYIKCEP